ERYAGEVDDKPVGASDACLGERVGQILGRESVELAVAAHHDGLPVSFDPDPVHTEKKTSCEQLADDVKAGGAAAAVRLRLRDLRASGICGSGICGSGFRSCALQAGEHFLE